MIKKLNIIKKRFCQKSFTRRNRLIEIEKQAQNLWQNSKINEKDVNHNKPKYLVTFPYPYMNGKLHMGHGFTMSKADFICRYKQLKGFNTLFPFGFHCTGMPISASAKRLKEEFDNLGEDELKRKWESRKNENTIENVNIENNNEKKNSKLSQYEILRESGVDKKLIKFFQNPEYWLEYFPKKAIKDLKLFGMSVDFRRSFITTKKNPFYDSFIKWQFTKLKERGFLKFGEKPSIFSVKDNQICADHDRTIGEGVKPQKYTLIKLKLEDDAFQIKYENKSIYLLAATLRPETMYGQTNCFIKPEGEYGIYKKNNEIIICSERSIKNIKYQNKKSKIEQLNTIKGEELITKKIKAPLSIYKSLYILPMFNINMEKGTGIVTSVPSDSTDDFATLKDIKKKEKLLKKFKIKPEMLNTTLTSIIKIPNYSDLSALKAYKDLKIQSPNEKEKLNKAKDLIYTQGYYKGIMNIGDYKGITVKEAKLKIEKDLLDQNLAEIYYEPEDRCVSRSGDECIVANCDQWYIEYGKEFYKGKIKAFIKSEKFVCFNDILERSFLEAVEWLEEWGCSRSSGLGTFLPWDEKYLIESLSDSTIYMAFYTFCHLLQKDIEGIETGVLGIEAEELTTEVWDYILLDKNEYNEKLEKKFSKLKEEFNYWYPVDLRCSGKDLIRNHLTMSLYNHYFIWGEKYLPKNFYCNGWILINGEKMSKNLGNFYTLEDFCKEYSTDATRIALANTSDTIDNANLELNEANMGILKLSNLENVIKEIVSNKNYRKKNNQNKIPSNIHFYDQIFENQIKNIIKKSDEFYNCLLMREVVKLVFFQMNDIREEYKNRCGNIQMREDLIYRWLEVQLIILYPITPHFCEIIWKDYFSKIFHFYGNSIPEMVNQASFPVFDEIDFLILEKNDYLRKQGNNLRSVFEKLKNKSNIKEIYIVTSDAYEKWQIEILDLIRDFLKNNDFSYKDVINYIKINISNKSDLKRNISFASFKIKEYEISGIETLNSELKFNEKLLLKNNLELLCKDIIDINLIKIKELSQISEDDNIQKKIKNCLPQKPVIIIN